MPLRCRESKDLGNRHVALDGPDPLGSVRRSTERDESL